MNNREHDERENQPPRPMPPVHGFAEWSILIGPFVVLLLIVLVTFLMART